MMLDVRCAQGECVSVPHLSLIEIADVSLLFMVNHEAVRRITLRSQKFSNGFYPEYVTYAAASV